MASSTSSKVAVEQQVKQKWYRKMVTRACEQVCEPLSEHSCSKQSVCEQLPFLENTSETTISHKETKRQSGNNSIVLYCCSKLETNENIEGGVSQVSHMSANMFRSATFQVQNGTQGAEALLGLVEYARSRDLFCQKRPRSINCV